MFSNLNTSGTRGCTTVQSRIYEGEKEVNVGDNCRVGIVGRTVNLNEIVVRRVCLVESAFLWREDNRRIYVEEMCVSVREGVGGCI